MKKSFILLGLMLLLTFTGFGQNDKYSKDTEDLNGQTKKGTRQRKVKENKKTQESGKDNILLESGTSLDAKLLSTLDVKKTKVGDEVVLKTTSSIKQDGEVIVPKGTKLIGRVTEVKRKTKEDKSSKISMVFESLQNKNLTAPINASIVSIVNVNNKVQATDMFGGSTSGSARSTTRSSGGLLGGTTGAVGGVLNSTTNTVSGVTNTVGNTAGKATSTVGRTVNGIQISQSVNASASGSSTLSAENKNIRLQKGTQFQLQLNESIQK